MTIEECADIINQLPSSCEIILHGGEPLLDEKMVISAIQAFRKVANGRKLSLQTNGVINNKMRLILLKNKDILRIGISIDGASEQNILRRDSNGKPVFKSVDDTISFFEENNINIKCIATVNAINIHSPIAMMEYFMSHKNITQVRFNPCFDMHGNRLADYAISPNEFLQFLCAVTDYWIEKRVYKIKRVDPLQSEVENALYDSKSYCLNCCKFISIYPNKKYTLCDALGMELFEADSLSNIFDLAEQHFNNTTTNPCNSCMEVTNCGGGCTAIFRRFKDSNDLIDEYCNYRKELKKLIKNILTNI